MYQAPEGIITPLVTPFQADESFDEKRFRDLVRYIDSCGVHGLSPGGSTGEGSCLADGELRRAVEICREESKLPIVAGVIRNSTRQALSAAKVAKEAGASALMVTPTSYNVLVPDDAGNVDFYKRIAGETGLPVIIYNVVPQNEIKPEVFKEIIKIDGVVGIKQSCGGMQGFYDMLMQCGDMGKIYSATDDMLYSTFSLGAAGAIAAILCVFPKEAVAIWDAVKNGDHQTARVLQDMLYEPWRIIKGPHFSRRIKEALTILGHDVGISRGPILDATPEEKANLKKAMAPFI